MDLQFKDLVLECNNCHLQFYASELKVDEINNLLTCVNCLRQPGSIVKILKDRPLQQNKPESVDIQLPRLQVVSKKNPSRQMDIPPGHSLFQCENCRYEFTRRSSFSNHCPYCNKSNRLRLLRSN